MIRVLITDDIRLWRLGVRTLLKSDQDIDVVGEARDGQEAIELAERLSPDVILMDIAMPRLDGLLATARIKAQHPNTRVMILAGTWDESVVRQAIQAGVEGYLPKDIEPGSLVSAVHAVYEHKTSFDPRVSQWLTRDTASS